MPDVDFQILVHCPIALTKEIADAIHSQTKPEWTITGISAQRKKPNIYSWKISISPEDLQLDDNRQLTRFRDTFLSLLALITMQPVTVLSKGTFTFHLEGTKYAQKSLGPMNYEYPEIALHSLGPLVEGFGQDAVYKVTSWHILQALCHTDPIYRFISLAVACELVIGKDSPVGGSKPPRCNTCKEEIGKCPHCSGELKIPVTLREKANFLFLDEETLGQFIDFRNRIFHGGVATEIGKDFPGLNDINNQLLVILRNYLGEKIGLKPITVNDLSVAVNPPNVSMTVTYTTEKPEQDSI